MWDSTLVPAQTRKQRVSGPGCQLAGFMFASELTVYVFLMNKLLLQLPNGESLNVIVLDTEGFNAPNVCFMELLIEDVIPRSLIPKHP